jgi:hypothetical protein
MSKVRAEQFTNKAGNSGPNFPFGLSGIGIHSAGTTVHTGIITALNFVGAGNTFSVTGSRVDISIAGGGGGLGESAVSGTDDLIVSVSNQAEITSNVVLESTEDDTFMTKRRALVISSGGSIDVGSGEVMIINPFDI